LDTRDLLLDAARKEFDEKGYYLTNGDTITKRADLGHGTFYTYFKNKNEVLIELLRQSPMVMFYMEYQHDPQYLLRHVSSPIELEIIIREMVKPLSEMPSLLKALLQGMLQDEGIASFGMQVKQGVARMFKLLIKARQETGWLRDCDAGILSEIIVVCLIGSVLLTASEVIECNAENLSRNLSCLITPVLFPNKHFPRSRRAKMSSPDNDKIRQELLEAAKEEFVAHGYFDTKIANIAQKSGYNRRTFYHYFKNKDDLLDALFVDILDKYHLQVNTQANFIEALDLKSIEDLVHILTEFLQALGDPMARTILQGFFNSPDLMKRYKEIYALYGEPVAKKMSELQILGLCSGIDLKIAAYIIIATVSLTAYLRSRGFVNGSIHKCALNLGWFLFHFFYYTKQSE
jgi:AcrR family transcriptional regulator